MRVKPTKPKMVFWGQKERVTKMEITASNYVVMYNPVFPGHTSDGELPGAIKVVLLGSNQVWDRRYGNTIGCCFSERHKMSDDQKKMMMMVDFHTVVVGANIKIEDAHREFLKIKEYRFLISPDIPGAEIDD